MRLSRTTLSGRRGQESCRYSMCVRLQLPATNHKQLDLSKVDREHWSTLKGSQIGADRAGGGSRDPGRAAPDRNWSTIRAVHRQPPGGPGVPFSNHSARDKGMPPFRKGDLAHLGYLLVSLDNAPRMR